MKVFMDILSQLHPIHYLVIALILYMAISFTRSIIKSIRKYSRLQTHGVSTIGSIIGYEPRNKKKDGGDSEASLAYTPIIQFTDYHGILHTISMPELFSYRMKPIGTAYPIKFDPEKPQDAMADTSASFRYYVLFGILGWIFGIWFLIWFGLKFFKGLDK